MCIFCEKSKHDNGLPKNDTGYSVYDDYPVSPLHTLIIPRQHYKTYFVMPDNVKLDCIKLIDEVCDFLCKKDHTITAFNVGFNAGTHAGQTIMHAHIHVIPRRIDDMEDPRGGIRHCILGKGYY